MTTSASTPSSPAGDKDNSTAVIAGCFAQFAGAPVTAPIYDFRADELGGGTKATQPCEVVPIDRKGPDDRDRLG